MTVSNYKSTIGGAFSALGTALMGIGVVPQLSGNSSKLLTYIATSGFICTAVGQFLGHLFAADAKTVADMGVQVVANTQAIQTTATAVATGDTTTLAKVATARPPSPFGVSPPVASPPKVG